MHSNLGKYEFKLAVIVTVSTLVLILEHYHSIPLDFPDITPVVYYLLIPLTVSFLVFREKPSDFGIRLGNWKLALISVVLCLTVMTVTIYLVSNLQSFENYYKSQEGIDWGRFLINAALYMFAWEFIFRGYMLFGLEKSIGTSAVFLQSIPFTLLHIGKPELEALTAFFGGCILGYIAYRTRSFLPCFIIHYGMYIMMHAF